MDAFKLLLFAVVLCMSMRTGLSANSYYRVSKKDVRRCGPPICGGYFIKKVNSVNETYVFAIRTNGLPKDVQATYNKFIAQFPGKFDLVVYEGRLIRNTQSAAISDLFVTNVYLGYPGVTVPLGPGIGYYSISQIGTNAKASLLNTVKSVTVPTTNVTTLSLSQILSQEAPVDESVQQSQILSKGALVLASAKASTVLVKQVFFKIAVTAGPSCPVSLIVCNTPLDKFVYFRNPSLCFIPKCLKKADINFCLFFVPSCPTGYKLAGWPVAERGGCPSYTCDPVFFPDATKLGFN